MRKQKKDGRAVSKVERWRGFLHAYFENARDRQRAGKKVGVHERTVNKWFQEPEFIAMLEEMSEQLDSARIANTRKILEDCINSIAIGVLDDPKFALQVAERLDPHGWHSTVVAKRAEREMDREDPEEQTLQRFVIEVIEQQGE